DLNEKSGVLRSDNSVESETFNPTHLKLLDREVADNFLGTSYLCVGLTCTELDLPTFAFPLFGIHSKIAFFTEYDRCLFQIVSTYLSRFITNHRKFLPTHSRLFSFEQDSLKGFFSDPTIPEFSVLDQCEHGESSHGLYWKACSLRAARRINDQLELADTFAFRPWPIVDCNCPDRPFGCEVTHRL